MTSRPDENVPTFDYKIFLELLKKPECAKWIKSFKNFIRREENIALSQGSLGLNKRKQQIASDLDSFITMTELCMVSECEVFHESRFVTSTVDGKNVTLKYKRSFESEENQNESENQKPSSQSIRSSIILAIREFLERILCSKLSRAIDKVLSTSLEEDAAMMQKLVWINSWISPEYLNLNPEIETILNESAKNEKVEASNAAKWVPRNSWMSSAQKVFDQSDQLQFPKGKLAVSLHIVSICVEICSVMMTKRNVDNSVEVEKQDDNAVTNKPNTDDLLPTLIWIVIRCLPKRLVYSSTYVSSFRHPSFWSLCARDHFSFILFLSAVEFIKNLRVPSIQIPIYEKDAVQIVKGSCPLKHLKAWVQLDVVKKLNLLPSKRYLQTDQHFHSKLPPEKLNRVDPFLIASQNLDRNAYIKFVSLFETSPSCNIYRTFIMRGVETIHSAIARGITEFMDILKPNYMFMIASVTVSGLSSTMTASSIFPEMMTSGIDADYFFKVMLIECVERYLFHRIYKALRRHLILTMEAMYVGPSTEVPGFGESSQTPGSQNGSSTTSDKHVKAVEREDVTCQSENAGCEVTMESKECYLLRKYIRNLEHCTTPYERIRVFVGICRLAEKQRCKDISELYGPSVAVSIIYCLLEERNEYLKEMEFGLFFVERYRHPFLKSVEVSRCLHLLTIAISVAKQVRNGGQLSCNSGNFDLVKKKVQEIAIHTKFFASHGF